MAVPLKEMTDYLIAAGAGEIAHTDKGYVAHAIGVYNDLKSWGCDEELSRVGIFHSIYGTELSQGFTLPLEKRSEVQQLIGERAERISFLNCVMDRTHFDAHVRDKSAPCMIVNRLTQETIPVSDEDFRDLCVVHLCDWLEQVERWGKWNYRRDAFVQLANRLDGLDLLITDMVMPVMGGWELSRELRRTAANRPLSVLYISGYPDSINLELLKGGSTGVAFLPKPFTPDALLRKVREILNLSRNA